MKFTCRSLQNTHARIGSLTDIPRLPGKTLSTPLLLLYTKAGSIPHLTHEVLQMVTKEHNAIQIPLPSMIHTHNTVCQFQKGIASFIGLKEYLIYCTVQDPAGSTPEGFNQKDSVGLLSRHGVHNIDAKEYMSVMESFQPDMYQALCDGDITISSTKKRIDKSVHNTQTYLEECLSIHGKSKRLKNSAILGVIEGGYDLCARTQAATFVAKMPVSGFVIDGLHTNGHKTVNLSTDVKPILKEVVDHLPEDKFRIIHGCWEPEAVINMVDMGIDIFDASYPFIASEEGYALTFKYRSGQSYRPNAPEIGVNFHPENECEPNEESLVTRCDGTDRHKVFLSNNDAKETHLHIKDSTVLKGTKCDTDKKMEPTKAEIGKDVSKPLVLSKYGILLKDQRFADDFSPLCNFCKCLTCRKYTRAYIHHLLVTRELLGPVLLMMHNLYHYLAFFEAIRENVKSGSLNDLRKYL